MLPFFFLLQNEQIKPCEIIRKVVAIWSSNKAKGNQVSISAESSGCVELFRNIRSKSRNEVGAFLLVILKFQA
jgi:hypothetical protein